MSPTVDGSLLAPRLPIPSAFPRLEFPRRELRRGEALYRAGDPADTVYRVEEGLLKVSIDVPGGKERIISVAGPGDLLGAVAPVQRAYRDSASALGAQARVAVVPRDELPEELTEQLLAAAGYQVARLLDALEDGELQVPMRIARALLRLGERFGQPAGEGVIRMTLPLTQEHLAAMIGAARETTTAGLGELRSRGLLHGTRGRYSYLEGPLRDYLSSAGSPLPALI